MHACADRGACTCQSWRKKQLYIYCGHRTWLRGLCTDRTQYTHSRFVDCVPFLCKYLNRSVCFLGDQNVHVLWSTPASTTRVHLDQSRCMCHHYRLCRYWDQTFIGMHTRSLIRAHACVLSFTNDFTECGYHARYILEAIIWLACFMFMWQHVNLRSWYRHMTCCWYLQVLWS